MHVGAVDGDVVSDGNIVADGDGALLIERVEDGSVLNVDMVADADAVDVAAQHGVEPDAATVADDGVTDDGCVLG